MSNRYSSVGIVQCTSWIIGGSAFASWLENRIFPSSQHADQLDELFRLLFTYRVFKRPKREADNSPPYTTAFNLNPISNPKHFFIPQGLIKSKTKFKTHLYFKTKCLFHFFLSAISSQKTFKLFTPALEIRVTKPQISCSYESITTPSIKFGIFRTSF